MADLQRALRRDWTKKVFFVLAKANIVQVFIVTF